MSRNNTFFIGILGVTLFSLASIVGGFQLDNYSHLSQFISETYAIDTPYGQEIRYFGYIPCGLLLTIFSFLAIKKLPSATLIKLGFLGLAVFYGIANIIVGIFPCDKGCNKEFINPSISQIIHNLTGGLTYLFVPLSILLIGIGLQSFKTHLTLSKIALFCAVNSLIFVGILFSNPASQWLGLYQRIIELSFIVWIIACSFSIKNNHLIETKTTSI